MKRPLPSWLYLGGAFVLGGLILVVLFGPKASYRPQPPVMIVTNEVRT